MIWSGRVRNERPHEKSDPANTIGGLAHGVQVYVPGAFQPGEIKNSEGFLDAMSLLLSPRLGVSLELGESIQKSMVASLRVQPFRVFRFGPQAGKFIYEIPGRPYGLMARNLYMLRRLRPPAVLVEGPHLNSLENSSRFLAEQSGETSFTRQIAESIARGIRDFVKKCDRPTAAPRDFILFTQRDVSKQGNQSPFSSTADSWTVNDFR